MERLKLVSGNGKTAPGTMGRPSGYSPKYCKIVEEMCRLGATDVEVAKALEVQVSAIYDWRNKYEAFSAAMRTGKDFADERVVRSLYQNAIEGDTTAQIFWLKNRRPGEWRDKHDLNHGGTITHGTSAITIENVREHLITKIFGVITSIEEEELGVKHPKQIEGRRAD